MEFGKLESVDHVDWTLPSEDPLTEPYLSTLKAGRTRQSKTKFYIGAPAWGRKEWVGRIYPPQTSASAFLYHYSRNFNCIELNTTHYRIPTEKIVKGWVEQVPEDFLFCPKIPQSISHDPGGLRDPRTLSLWLESLEHFGRHLGPCFLQLPPYFEYAAKAELFHFLKAWPKDIELSLELRHPTWIQDGHILPALVEYLQSRRIGLVITDVAGRRDILHDSVSAPFSLLRFIGNNLHPSDFTRTQAWSKKIAQWQEWGLERFFFMVHQPDDVRTPEMTEQVIDDLNQICDAGLPQLSKPLLL